MDLAIIEYVHFQVASPIAHQIVIHVDSYMLIRLDHVYELGHRVVGILRHCRKREHHVIRPLHRTFLNRIVHLQIVHLPDFIHNADVA